MQTFIKDPNAIKDYSIDWSDWLVDDTILTSTWAVVAGDVAIADDEDHLPTKSETATVVWLSGGTLNTEAIITNHVTTNGDRAEDTSFRIQVRRK